MVYGQELQRTVVVEYSEGVNYMSQDGEWQCQHRLYRPTSGLLRGLTHFWSHAWKFLTANVVVGTCDLQYNK